MSNDLTISEYSNLAIQTEAPITQATCNRYVEHNVVKQLSKLYATLNDFDFDKLKRHVYYGVPATETSPFPQEAILPFQEASQSENPTPKINTPDGDAIFDPTQQTMESLPTEDLMAVREIRFAHAILGIMSEVFEALDIFLECEGHFSEDDLVHLSEESSDIRWYQNLLDHVTSVPSSTAASRNIAKLVSRYGSKFSLSKTLNRDLHIEGIILGKKMS